MKDHQKHKSRDPYGMAALEQALSAQPNYSLYQP